MKKLFLAFVVLTLVALTGCKKEVVTMDSARSVELVAEAFDKNIILDFFRVLSVHWKEREELTNELGQMTIVVVDIENNRYEQKITFDGDVATPGELKPINDGQTYDFATLPSLSPADFDAAKFAAAFDAAKTRIHEDTKFHAISDVIMTFSPETGEKITEFAINVIDKDWDMNKPVLMFGSLYFRITPEGELEEIK